jgi:hypothetical protein
MIALWFLAAIAGLFAVAYGLDRFERWFVGLWVKAR